MYIWTGFSKETYAKIDATLQISWCHFTMQWITMSLFFLCTLLGFLFCSEIFFFFVFYNESLSVCCALPHFCSFLSSHWNIVVHFHLWLWLDSSFLSLFHSFSIRVHTYIFNLKFKCRRYSVAVVWGRSCDLHLLLIAHSEMCERLCHGLGENNIISICIEKKKCRRGRAIKKYKRK